MTSTAIVGASRIVSGDIRAGFADGDALLVEDGHIAAVGDASLADDAERVIDVSGMVVTPGLIDTHLHPSFGDYTERQEAHGFIDRSVQGGVTTFVSTGECHVPARPRDAAGTKALALLAHKVWKRQRPRGAKVHGGALILEPGLTRDDFADLANEGVWLVGEIGLGAVIEPDDAEPMVAWAREFGFKVLAHVGGASIPGSSTIGYEHVRRIAPDVAVHLNGGPTALADEEIEAIAALPDIALEIINCGNFRAALTVIDAARRHDALSRVIFGNDMPSGVGVTPLGIVRTVAYVSSVAGVPVEQAIAMASGNAAAAFDLDVGVLAPGRPADLLVLDTPPGSPGRDALDALALGNHPSIKLVMIDGEVQVNRSTITPQSERDVRFVR